MPHRDDLPRDAWGDPVVSGTGHRPECERAEALPRGGEDEHAAYVAWRAAYRTCHMCGKDFREAYADCAVCELQEDLAA